MAGVSSIVGAGAALGSAFLGSRASSRAADAQRDAINASRTQLNPFSVFGPGGFTASYGLGGGSPVFAGGTPGFNFQGGDGISSLFGRAFAGLNGLPGAGGRGGFGNTVQFGAGDLESARAALSRFATQGIPSAGFGLPGNVQNAASALRQATNRVDLGLNDLNPLQRSAFDAFRMARGDLGEAQALQNTAFRGAARQLRAAGRDFGDVRDDTLALLREQAQPFEERQFAGLQQNQFATGRLGSTGGALQTEAFARGLGQADLSRQLAASDEARAAQSQALAIGTGLGGFGSDLLSQAFGRFGQTAGLVSDISGERFRRTLAGAELGRQNLQTQIGLAGLPAQLQGAQLQNVLAALQGQSGIFSQGLQTFQAGLAAEQAAANARIGAGSNMAQIVSSPAFATAGYGGAAALGQLASIFAPSGGYASALASLFGQPSLSSFGGAFSNPMVTG